MDVRNLNEEIITKYFVADGIEAQEIILEAKTARDKHFDKVNALVAKYGADAAWGGRSEITSLAFKHDSTAKPEMKEGFLRPKIDTSDGQRYAVYSPDKRYKAGKDIVKELEEVGSFNFSDFIIGRLKMNCAVFGTINGRMVRSVSGAGHYGEKLVVRLPCGGDSRPEEITIPAFLREIKKSEFIALSEEGA